MNFYGGEAPILGRSAPSRFAIGSLLRPKRPLCQFGNTLTQGPFQPRSTSSNRYRLWCSHESVGATGGIIIDTNDDSARIYPGWIREGGSREVERSENAVPK